jgi:hypothetical protein
MKCLFERMTFANIVAVLALVFAMAGTGVASPVVHSAANALGVAKKADKRAKKADKRARSAARRARNASKLARQALSLAGSAGTKAQQALDSKLDANGKAVDAERLDGLDSVDLKIKCASGLVPAGGVCFEPTARAASTFFSANNACSQAGRRLPGLSELFAFGYANGMTALEWTDVYHTEQRDGGAFAFTVQLIAVTAGGGGFSSNVVDTGTSHPFRCVAGPSN